MQPVALAAAGVGLRRQPGSSSSLEGSPPARRRPPSRRRPRRPGRRGRRPAGRRRLAPGRERGEVAVVGGAGRGTARCTARTCRAGATWPGPADGESGACTAAGPRGTARSRATIVAQCASVSLAMRSKMSRTACSGEAMTLSSTGARPSSTGSSCSTSRPSRSRSAATVTRSVSSTGRAPSSAASVRARCSRWARSPSSDRSSSLGVPAGHPQVGRLERAQRHHGVQVVLGDAVDAGGLAGWAGLLRSVCGHPPEPTPGPRHPARA